MASMNFDATAVDPEFGFEPIPAGEYLATITESENKTTKNGNGQYLQLTWEVLSGEYKGRKLWSRLNLNNPNETAVKIARAELSQVCHAVNVMQVRDSSQLHNIPCGIKVACRKRADTGEMTNEIKKYIARSEMGKTTATENGSDERPY